MTESVYKKNELDGDNPFNNREGSSKKVPPGEEEKKPVKIIKKAEDIINQHNQGRTPRSIANDSKTRSVTIDDEDDEELKDEMREAKEGERKTIYGAEDGQESHERRKAAIYRKKSSI